jgi:hypothetical protein
MNLMVVEGVRDSSRGSFNASEYCESSISEFGVFEPLILNTRLAIWHSGQVVSSDSDVEELEVGQCDWETGAVASSEQQLCDISLQAQADLTPTANNNVPTNVQQQKLQQWRKVLAIRLSISRLYPPELEYRKKITLDKVRIV